MGRYIILTGTIRKNKAEIQTEILRSPIEKVNLSIFIFKYEITLISYVLKNKHMLLLSILYKTPKISYKEHNKPIMIS